MFGKIGVIGGGMIGGVLCQEIPRRRLARRLALVDIMPPDMAKGKCLDIAEGSPVVGFDCGFDAGKTYEVLEGAELVINTAGVPRKPKPDGTLPSREELLATNLKITEQVALGIKEYCPDAVVISIANPLDAIWAGVTQTYYSVAKAYLTFERMIFTRSVGVENVAGPLGILHIGSQLAQVSIWEMLYFLGLLSANLAVELPEAVIGSAHYRTLFVAALVLFFMTFVLNTLAELVRRRFRRRMHAL